ncbi:MAG: SHOCT domain-containing protein [Anaerolineales bacterium]|jgi:hypothetical protein|nr:SHOCT domain-containing protein [Anaerolineales bacterium]
MPSNIYTQQYQRRKTMEQATPSTVSNIRKNYNLLLFLVVTSVPLFLWAIIMVFDVVEGIVFRDPEKIMFDIFVVFVLPLIIAPIISGLALLIAKLLSIPVIRWFVILGLGIITPLVVFALVFVAHFVTRKFYTGDKNSLPSILSVMIKNGKTLQKINQDPSNKLADLKQMLDKGLISQQDYERKKADILSEL